MAAVDVAMSKTNESFFDGAANEIGLVPNTHYNGVHMYRSCLFYTHHLLGSCGYYQWRSVCGRNSLPGHCSVRVMNNTSISVLVILYIQLMMHLYLTILINSNCSTE